MTTQDWILLISAIVQVLAVLVAPLIALRVNQKLQDNKEKHERKTWLFRTLMATRAATLAPEHVQALNMIDIEFHGNEQKCKDVVEAWKAYLDLLNNSTMNPDIWVQKREELLIDLLFKMAISLGYDLSKTTIKGTSYFPRAHSDLESDQVAIRKGFAQIIEGKRAFPVVVIDPPKQTVEQIPENGKPVE